MVCCNKAQIDADEADRRCELQAMKRVLCGPDLELMFNIFITDLMKAVSSEMATFPGDKII